MVFSAILAFLANLPVQGPKNGDKSQKMTKINDILVTFLAILRTFRPTERCFEDGKVSKMPKMDRKVSKIPKMVRNAKPKAQRVGPREGVSHY